MAGVVVNVIHKEYGLYFLYCDICFEEESGAFESFYDAVQYKKEYGWKSQKIDGERERSKCLMCDCKIIEKQCGT